jgi:hypothetical protein
MRDQFGGLLVALIQPSSIYAGHSRRRQNENPEDFKKYLISLTKPWLATQCKSHLSPAKFPANREFYREDRDFRPVFGIHRARNRSAAGTVRTIP